MYFIKYFFVPFYVKSFIPNWIKTRPNFYTRFLRDLFISCLIYRGNTGLLCKSVLESIDRGGVHFVDLDSTSCLTNQTFNWFMSTDSIPLRQLVRMKQLQSECPFIPGHGNCTCDAERMTYKVIFFKIGSPLQEFYHIFYFYLNLFS